MVCDYISRVLLFVAFCLVSGKTQGKEEKMTLRRIRHLNSCQYNLLTKEFHLVECKQSGGHKKGVVFKPIIPMKLYEHVEKVCG